LGLNADFSLYVRERTRLGFTRKLEAGGSPSGESMVTAGEHRVSPSRLLACALGIAYHLAPRPCNGESPLLDSFDMPVATTVPHPHFPPTELGRLSPWQESVRSHPLLNKGKDDVLPETADVVIIGSGMCGMSMISLADDRRGNCEHDAEIGRPA
jgi:hypothetical protein